MPKSKKRRPSRRPSSPRTGSPRTGTPLEAIPFEPTTGDPDRKVAVGPTGLLAGSDLVMPPDMIYADDRVEMALTARGWVSARSDPSAEFLGDAWAFDTDDEYVLGPSRALATLTATTIEVEPARGSALTTHSYTTLEALLADIETIEAWPHERDVDDQDALAQFALASGPLGGHIIRDNCSECGARVDWIDPAQLAIIDRHRYLDEYKHKFGVELLLDADAWVCTQCPANGVVLAE